MKQSVNLVWFKRDLRLHDHEALLEATRSELPYLLFYTLEPSIISYPDTSERHLQFVYHSILAMNAQLEKYNTKVELFYAEAEEVLSFLSQTFEIKNIYSYQESGISLTYKRDREVKKWCAAQDVFWKEFQRDGIIRGIKDRIDWDKHWFEKISKEIEVIHLKVNKLAFDNPFPLPADLKIKLIDYPTTFQKAGEPSAWAYLNSFLKDRGKNYARHISKPLLSRKSCARISPFLAWGNISIRQVYQAVKKHENYARYKFGFDGMLTRLHWHCHFMQKFEVECRYETLCVNTGFETLKHDNREDLLQAWVDGRTGYPLIDACMRCLVETGWINFRMRAMLVSFLCFNIDQDWRRGVYRIANLFLDYEPGIHYPQFQMQAGVTGVNTVRIYNPVKQSEENDPDGEFIKRWVPELEKIPLNYLHQPWKMPLLEQQMYGIKIGIDYPMPIVDLSLTSKIAKDKIWGHRKEDEVKADKKRIIDTHVRRKNKK